MAYGLILKEKKESPCCQEDSEYHHGKKLFFLIGLPELLKLCFSSLFVIGRNLESFV